jgi:hypothetical protein
MLCDGLGFERIGQHDQESDGNEEQLRACVHPINIGENITHPGPSSQLEPISPMTISRLRTALYAITRYLGDLNAILHRRIGKRIARRMSGRAAGRLLGRLFR